VGLLAEWMTAMRSPVMGRGRRCAAGAV